MFDSTHSTPVQLGRANDHYASADRLAARAARSPLLGAAVIASVALFAAGPAAGETRAYCSETGDGCQWVEHTKQGLRVVNTYAEAINQSSTVCVESPAGRRCSTRSPHVVNGATWWVWPIRSPRRGLWWTGAREFPAGIWVGRINKSVAAPRLSQVSGALDGSGDAILTRAGLCNSTGKMRSYYLAYSGVLAPGTLSGQSGKFIRVGAHRCRIVNAQLFNSRLEPFTTKASYFVVKVRDRASGRFTRRVGRLTTG